MTTSTLASIPASREVEDAIIHRALEILDRRMFSRDDTFPDPKSVSQYLALRLKGNLDETFLALYLDTRHRLIACEELFRGTVDGAEIHPRVIVRQALAHNAAAVIVGHNHPSGNPEPSAADRAVTVQLKQSLALVDVRLLDHFVIGDGAPVSMASRGWV